MLKARAERDQIKTALTMEQVCSHFQTLSVLNFGGAEEKNQQNRDLLENDDWQIIYSSVKMVFELRVPGT